MAAKDPVAAYGLALLKGRDDAGRASFLREVVQASPSSYGGLLAASQLQQMNRPVIPGGEGQAIIDAMNRLPSTLWRFDVERNPWISVRANFTSVGTQFLEPIKADLVVSNLMGVPLPIDQQFGIDTTAMINIAAYIAGRQVGQLPPIVVDLGRRLTLGPNQRLVTPIRVDRSVFGLFVTQAAGRTLGYNTTFMHSPRFTPTGGIALGPLGGIDTVRSLQAFIPGYSDQNLTQWADDARHAAGLKRHVAQAMIARLGDNGDELGLGRDNVRGAVTALNEVFEPAGPAEKAWILLMLKPQAGARSSYSPLLELGQRSDSAMVRIAYLISQTREADDRALATAIRDGSPRVQRFAEAYRTFLQLPPPPSPEVVGDPAAGR